MPESILLANVVHWSSVATGNPLCGSDPGEPATWERDEVSCLTCYAMLETNAGRVRRRKPEAVCRWAFEMVGARPEDDLDDMFPGTGAVGRAWDSWKRKFLLPEAA